MDAFRIGDARWGIGLRYKDMKLISEGFSHLTHELKEKVIPHKLILKVITIAGLVSLLLVNNHPIEIQQVKQETRDGVFVVVPKAEIALRPILETKDSLDICLLKQ